MASKSKKTPASSSQAAPSSASQARSPLSPTRLTRLQEKVELQNLNDRLAAYIDRVRQLESENNRLTLQIHTTQDTVQREVTSVRNSYEKELSDTRLLLDETAKEKARLQLDAGRIRAELGELTQKYNKVKNDLAEAEKKVHQLETKNNEHSASLHQLNQDLVNRSRDLAKALEEKKELASERDKLNKQIPELQKQLETELLARTDLENRNMTLREELAFKQQMYEREMTEVRSSKQVEISEIDGRLQEHYQARLQSALQELRDHYESQMKHNRDEVEVLYQNKVSDLEDQAQKQRSAASSHYEELLQARTRLDGFNSKLSELESSNNHLKNRIAELEKSLDQERSAHASAMATCQGEINRLREQMAIQLQEYQDLMDIRTALDMEIAAYRKLLEAEESRLNLTPTMTGGSTSQSLRSGTPSRRTPTRALKRKRTMLEESSSYSLADFITTSSAKGDMEVAEVDPEGKFIRLLNKGEKEVSLSGWQLVHKAQETETIYKFHRSLKVAPGATVSVWSAGSGTAHEPPSTLVMKEQRWFVASEMVTQLLNSGGEEMAQRESKRAQTTTSILRQREEYSGLGGPEELHHQQGDPDGKDRCIVM